MRNRRQFKDRNSKEEMKWRIYSRPWKGFKKGLKKKESIRGKNVKNRAINFIWMNLGIGGQINHLELDVSGSLG